MTEPLLLALDQGTSSSRAVLFNLQGEPVASAQVPLAIAYPADGWVEQQPLAIWESQMQAMQALDRQLNEEQRRAVCACGVTNQRETTLFWKRGNGTPLGPALVWQDRRNSAVCRSWQQLPEAAA